MRDLENNFLKPLQEWSQTQMPRNSGNKDVSAPCLGQLLLGWLVATREYKATIARSSVGFFFFLFQEKPETLIFMWNLTIWKCWQQIKEKWGTVIEAKWNTAADCICPKGHPLQPLL